MHSGLLASLVAKAYTDSTQQFWWFQILGWSGLTVVTFLSMTAWDEHIMLSHVTHAVLQSILGLAISVPLRYVYKRSWNFSIIQRFFICVLMVGLLAALWTSVRMETFMWMSGERGLWRDFGDWYFASIFIFLCWTALYYSIKYYQLQQDEHRQLQAVDALAREEQIKRYRAEAVAKEAQLKMLRYQLNPHFLFNTLNAIKALVVLDDGVKAQKMIQQLSEFLRYSLDNDPVVEVTLEQELEALIENSLQYAIAPSEDGGTSRIVSRVGRDRLHIELSDTRPGTQGEDVGSNLSTGRGVGLRNTLERLETYYGQDYTFKLSSSDPCGMTVTMAIPLSFADTITISSPVDN